MEVILLKKEEAKELGVLISCACNGPEHGVMDNETWKVKCIELAKFCRAHGIKVYGQWIPQYKES